jgi:hypothetical protein
MTRKLLKMAVFWVVAPCSLVVYDVSEVITASIIRAMNDFYLCPCLPSGLFPSGFTTEILYAECGMDSFGSRQSR